MPARDPLGPPYRPGLTPASFNKDPGWNEVATALLPDDPSYKFLARYPDGTVRLLRRVYVDAYSHEFADQGLERGKPEHWRPVPK